MKHPVFAKALLPFCCAVFFIACATRETIADKTATIPATEKAPVKPGPLSPALNAYYQLKDAFVKTDGTGADMAASQLRLSIDSLSARKLQVDTTLTDTISGYKKSLLASVDDLIKERDIEKKRRYFQALSDGLYSLAKALPYQGETIYQVHCPMAFKTGANWLNNQPVVANPYYGSAMPECGEVVDSLQGK